MHILERLKRGITVNEETGCWINIFNPSTEYGTVTFEGRLQVVSRVVWKLLIGEIPEGLILDHYRMNPGERNAPCSKRCCNPAHLEVVTYKENTRRGRLSLYLWGHTHAQGEKHAFSKLTEKKVLEIRRLYATGNYTHRGLANEFGVVHSLINDIINRKYWRHI